MQTSTQQQYIHLATRRLGWDFSSVPATPVANDVELSSFLLAISYFVVAFEDVGIPIVREAIGCLGDHATLAREARTFVSQEALHSRAHALFNRELDTRHGFDTSAIQHECARFVADMMKRSDPQWRLATVAALEHVIFSVADWYEKATDLHPRVDPAFHRLLLWHAMEETEHTAVVHDMYTHIYGSDARAYRVRVGALMTGSRMATRTILRIWRQLLPQVSRHTGVPPAALRGWRHFARRSLPYLGDVLSFFAPGFAPWNRNMPVDLLPRLREQLAPLGESGLIPMRVVSVADVARDVRAYQLAPADGQLTPIWTAGSHIDVEIEPGVVRQYSLCGPPDDRSAYRIAVKRQPDGRGGSLRMHQEIVVGSTLRISKPRNHFPLTPGSASEPSETLLIAGGIGVTPLLAMAQELHRVQANFSLEICARDHDSTPFRDEIGTWSFASRVRVHCDDDPAAAGPAAATLIPPWESTYPRMIYVCGHPSFTETVIATAHRMGWPEFAVRSERFVGAQGNASQNRPLTIHLKHSGGTVTVGGEESILEALEAHGMRPKNSCREGVCGACVCKVIVGEADHRDAVLSHLEQAEGQMAICVSRAKTDSLTLDL